MGACLLVLRPGGGNYSGKGGFQLGVVEAAQQAEILAHIVGADEGHVYALYRHDLLDVLHALPGFDLYHDHAFRVGAVHVGASIHLGEIRVGTGQGDAAVAHGGVFGPVHQRPGLFRCLGVGQQDARCAHLHHLQHMLPAQFRDADHCRQADGPGRGDHIRRLPRGEGAVLAVDDDEVKAAPGQDFWQVCAGKGGHHGAQQALAGLHPGFKGLFHCFSPPSKTGSIRCSGCA